MNTRSRVPVATILLIAANLAVAFLAVLAPDSVATFAFDSQTPTISAALTSLFLHYNVIHLLGNMVFLAAVGPAVETSAGVIRFLAVYLLGGIAGVLAHHFLAAQGTVLMGASASVAACAVYYSVRYSRLRVPLGPGFGVSVGVVVAIWALLQMVGAVVTLGQPSGGTAYWAHLGGLVVGLGLSLAFRAPALASLHFSYEVLEKMNERSVGATLAATENHLKKHPKDPKVLRERIEALASIGDEAEETVTLVELLDVAPAAEKPEILDRLAQIGGLESFSSLQLTHLAEQLKAENPDVSKKLLGEVIGRPEDDAQRPDALLALAGLEEDGSAEARRWLGELFDRFPLHPACELARVRGWEP